MFQIAEIEEVDILLSVEYCVVKKKWFHGVEEPDESGIQIQAIWFTCDKKKNNVMNFLDKSTINQIADKLADMEE